MKMECNDISAKGGPTGPRWAVYWHATRPRFLTASIVPVLVGTAAGLATTGRLDWPMFITALAGTVLIHAGSNVVNDYYDHLSGNDWVNPSPTPYSGGRQFIQRGILCPRATLGLGLLLLAAGGCIGIGIVAYTGSLFILALGLAGVLGGYFYTARPIQLGYRGVGEVVIGLLFGLLPVYGSYYLQGRSIDGLPLLPGLILSALIFLVILINEFPDRIADQQVGKRTLVVLFGPSTATRVYRTVLAATVALAGWQVCADIAGWAGLMYLLTLPLCIKAFNQVGLYLAGGADPLAANATTIKLHLVGGLCMAIGLVLDGRYTGPITYLRS